MFTIAVKKNGKVELIDIPEPVVGLYDVKVKTEVAVLCNATDRKLVDGHFPGVEKYPLLLGHESVGTVVAVGEKVKNFKVGERAIGGLLLNSTNSEYESGWGGFSEYTIIKDHHAMVDDGIADEEHGWAEVNEIQTPVTSSIPVEDAVLLCTWREVYGGLDDFYLMNNKDMNKIVIFGAGPVGLSFLKFLKVLGKEFVAVVDPQKEKQKLALQFGADMVFAPESSELKRLPETLGTKLDAVIDAVGHESIINQAVSLIRMAGSICVYGVLADPVVNLDKNPGPYNFNLLIHQWPTRFRERAAQGTLVEWIKAGKISYKDFITHEFSIKDINEAIAISRTGENLKILLRY